MKGWVALFKRKTHNKDERTVSQKMTSFNK